MAMHDSCVATKTISLEIDAYERLRKAKRNPSESFSSVVRRAVFPDSVTTAGDLLAAGRERTAKRSPLLTDEALDRLDRAQREPRSSSSHWERP
jgi:hypothetical protein